MLSDEVSVTLADVSDSSVKMCIRDRAQEEANRNNSNNNNNNNSNNSGNSSGGNKGNGGSSGSSSSYVPGSVVSRAKSALGKPYVWGAVGPNAFDCSGLVGFCLTGKYKRSYTSSSFAGLPEVSDPRPGDVCYLSLIHI